MLLVLQAVFLVPLFWELDVTAVAVLKKETHLPVIVDPSHAGGKAWMVPALSCAAVAAGAGPGWVLRRHVLPHTAPTLVGFVPIVMALALLTEAALSAMSVGVQAPAASWGTLIADGQALLYTRPLVAIAPGLAVVATVLALNVLADGVRDALDPRG